MAQGGNNPFLCPHCYIPFRYIEDLHHHYCPRFILMLQMESLRNKLFEMIQLTYELQGMVPRLAPPSPHAHENMEFYSIPTSAYPSCHFTFGSQSTTSNVCAGQGPLRPQECFTPASIPGEISTIFRHLRHPNLPRRS
ncbi:hypothetical protein P8452_07539 [Trifolium repens]|nr:hypothetical protein P8452_07539 [Trifolium repens]